MTTNLHVKRGREFRSDLYKTDNRKPWLEAVGKEIENKGVALKLGQGAGAVTVHNAAELLNFYAAYRSDPQAMADKVGLPKGRPLSEYMADLMQALDDVVKASSHFDPGSVIDLRTDGALAKTLGLTDPKLRYASSRTELGKALPQPEGSMSVLGVQLSRVEVKPKDPLEGVLHMDATTFAGNSLSKGRNSQEFETVRRLTGLDGADIVKLARTMRGDKSAFKRMRKASASEAFAVGFSRLGFDHVPWDKDAHATREALPYTSLTIEDGRLELDEKKGTYEVSQGTDFFADTYYVAKDPKDPKADLLLDNDIMVRARVRYDRPGQPRRILVQSKVGGLVDETGMKAAAKADIRDDSPTETEIAAMDNMVRSGISDWGGSYYGKRPIEAMGNVYASLAEKGALSDIGEHKGVLLLEPGANVFSTRSRYHLNETSPGEIKKLFDAGDKWIAELSALIDAAPDPAALSSLKDQASALQDRTAILERSREGLAALLGKAPADITVDDVKSYWPRRVSWGSNPSPTNADCRKVVADAVSAAYHDFAEAFDDMRRDIAGAKGGGAKDWRLGKDFMTFMRSEDSVLRSTTTVKPFLDYFDKKLAGPDKDAFVEKFAGWLKDEQNNPKLAEASDKDAALALIRKDMVNEHLHIMHRQVQASGTAATQLWFNEARDAYANINPTTFNFLIDTFDFVTDVKPEDWANLSDAQKNGLEEIPADKIYNADLISEVQIELGYEKPYTDAISKAKKNLAAAQAGIFMDFALANAGTSGVKAAESQTFKTYLSSLQALSPDQRASQLDQINAFAKDKGSSLQLDEASLKGLPTEQLTQANQGKDYKAHAGLVKTLETSEFIWNALVNAQEYIADLRGKRVVKEADRAGFSGLKWEVSDLSKGAKAISLLKD